LKGVYKRYAEEVSKRGILKGKFEGVLLRGILKEVL